MFCRFYVYDQRRNELLQSRKKKIKETFSLNVSADEKWWYKRHQPMPLGLEKGLFTEGKAILYCQYMVLLLAVQRPCVIL
jgi:hypothetical protein